MAMLGDLLAAAKASAGAFEGWLKACEPVLAEQVAEAAEEQQLSIPGYVRAAIADFSRFASEEDWATLTSSLRDSDDPGTVCLVAMVHWRLTANGCEGHSHQHHL